MALYIQITIFSFENELQQIWFYIMLHKQKSSLIHWNIKCTFSLVLIDFILRLQEEYVL